MWLFYYFHFERIYDVLKSRSLCILLNKNIKFNKNETDSKTENPTQDLERQIRPFIFIFTLSEYFFISKNITSYTLVGCF